MQTKSERAKAEELSEFLFQQLELRLPTEPTYATMTALISCNGTPSRFELHTALQTVKAAWRGISQRLQKILKEDKKAELLSALPKTWEDLPERIRLVWGDYRPAGCQEAPMSESYILRLAAKVPLRETDGAVSAMKAQPQLEVATLALKLMAGYARSPQKSNGLEEGVLKNLKIFASPKNKNVSADGTKALALETQNQQSMGLQNAACRAEQNLITKLTQPIASVESERQVGSKLLALEMPHSENPEASSSKMLGKTEKGLASGGMCVPGGPQSHHASQSLGQAEKDLAVGGICVSAGPQSHNASPTSAQAAQDLAVGGICVSAGPQSHHASQTSGQPQKSLALVEAAVSTGQRQDHASPSAGLEAEAYKFLQARGESAEESKGRKRKAPAGEVWKRPAAVGQRASKRPACIFKRPSKASLDEVPAPVLEEKKKVQKSAPSKEATKKYANRTFEAKVWGHCRVEFYSAKSYIRFFCEKKGRLSMVIGSVHGQHQEICDRLVAHVKKGKGREDLHAVRTQLEASLS